MAKTENMSGFDFVIGDNNEVLLVLNAQDQIPDEPALVLEPEEHSATLFRNEEQELTLENVSDDAFKALEDKDEVMVCEIAPTDNPDETRIVYNYYAEIIRDVDEEDIEVEDDLDEKNNNE